ncbi:DUF721 domain-containing protein [Chromohalobacter canadensis]|uniref:DciA family protein n=1 Tax=Chromohalobacter canadensis TaxID=141389 RepID=A0A285VRZ9_9GAMM|nr:DciA family protein [Chromohalobacter canadensis]MCK0769133.1 DUF721 domain-containing protein [Chromohalobacter canadensis]MCT8469545.1 DUF721 domain-containing protein [Chromohalobacter canadensis]MCT8472169.1 DUF721 domain-containing protein [Chromohalobacter canadensis]MCT8499719.1 DUF721 domain-containing protein [Chromohalobacter canadensis]WQH09422.1 DciA family protein [Chromohalobacter canadensis]
MSIKAKRFRAQSIHHLIDGSGELGSVVRMATLLQRAQQHLRAGLPAEIAEHVYVGGYREGALTLITDGAVWLTWLRYERQRLLTLLRQLPEFEAVLALNLKVRPVQPLKAPTFQARALSPEAAHHLKACADDTTDPKLKKALARLASHAPDDT